jgi:hypothetical protein
VGLGFELTALHLQSRQLYHLGRILLWLFLEIGSLALFALAGLEPRSSQIAGITGVSHSIQPDF